MFRTSCLLLMVALVLASPVVAGDADKDLSFARNNTDLVGLCFGPYLNGERPGNDYLPEPVIRERLAVIHTNTTWVRTFGIDGGLERVCPVAHELGMKVAVGAWISSDKPANNETIKKLIEIGKTGCPDIIVVGNEALLWNYTAPSELIDYIRQVKAAVPDIPVGTADVYGEFLEHRNVIEVSDIILANIYPFWEKVPVEEAPGFTLEKYWLVVGAAGGKPVIIGELGWPDSGSPNGSAVPSDPNAVRYLVETTALLHARDIPYFAFEAFDEDWKSNEGDVGSHWGLWYDNFTKKPHRLPLLKPLPGYTRSPTDPDDDNLYEDLNANGRKDFADVVLFFNQMDWVAMNEPVCLFDWNWNRRIDFADIVALFNEI